MSKNDLKHENYLLKQKVLSFTKEKYTLNESVAHQNKIFDKFTKKKKSLDMILKSQRCVIDKSGLGYKPLVHLYTLVIFVTKMNI